MKQWIARIWLIAVALVLLGAISYLIVSSAGIVGFTTMCLFIVGYLVTTWAIYEA